MDKLLVTGCIVTYNEEDTIEECIESILLHTKEINFKLYVSDNCSTDGTVSIIKEKFPQVKVIINDKNGGFGYGHNKILSKIDSDYHVVINPDIFMMDNAVCRMVAYMEEHKKVGMMTPKVLNLDGTQQFLPKRPPSIRYVILSKFKPFKKHRQFYTREVDLLDTSTDIEFCTGCFFCIRTELFKRLGGFDKRYYMYFEDADLSRSVLKDGNKIVFYPEVSVYHKWNRANTRSIKGIIRFLSSMVKYFNKWGWKLN